MAKRTRAATETQRTAAGAKRPTKRSSAAGKAGAKTPVAKAEDLEPETKTKKVAKAAKPAVKKTAAGAKPPSAKALSSREAGMARKAKPSAAKAAAKTTKPAAAAKPTERAPVAVASKPVPKRTKPRKAPPPPYLAAELGQPVDHEGEPIGAGSRAAFSDTELQTYTLQLWQQMQARRGVSLQIPAMERAGVTIDQIWTAGVTDRLTTSSTADEVRRYKQKLLFRANLLESILTETVSELHRLNSVEPTPSRSVGESG